MEYREKFLEEWVSSGGFIPQKIASKITKLSLQSIGRLIKEKKIRAHIEEEKETPLPYLKDILDYKPQENKKRTKKRKK